MEIRNRAAYMVTPGKMEIRELPMPQAQPGEVVLKIEYVASVDLTRISLNPACGRERLLTCPLF